MIAKPLPRFLAFHMNICGKHVTMGELHKFGLIEEWELFWISENSEENIAFKYSEDLQVV